MASSASDQEGVFKKPLNPSKVEESLQAFSSNTTSGESSKVERSISIPGPASIGNLPRSSTDGGSKDDEQEMERQKLQ